MLQVQRGTGGVQHCNKNQHGKKYTTCLLENNAMCLMEKKAGHRHPYQLCMQALGLQHQVHCPFFEWSHKETC